MKRVLAIAFLLAQVVGIAAGRVSGESFWAWAPHDSILDYQLQIWQGERPLPAETVRERYGLAERGRRFEPLADLAAVIRTRESRAADPMSCVQVSYRINLGPAQRWSWPAACEPSSPHP